MSSIRAKLLCGPVGGVVGTISGGLLGAAMGTGSGALSGEVGAVVLHAAGHAGFIASEAVKSGAVGGAIVGTGTGLLLGCMRGTLAGCGFFQSSDEKQGINKNGILILIGGAVLFAAEQALNCVVGNEVLKHSQDFTMSAGQMAAAGATGGAIVAIPFSVALACIGVAAAIACCCCALPVVAVASAVSEERTDAAVEHIKNLGRSV